MSKLYVIIPAAGSGTRFGQNNKLLYDINGRKVIERTLDAFNKFSFTTPLSIIIVTNEESIDSIKEIVDTSFNAIVKNVVLGSDTRQKSVWEGIKALSSMNPSCDDMVFIHDGARCLLDSEILNSCIKGLERSDVCVTGVKCKNTIKRCHITDSSEIIIDDTPPRESLYEVQTPQCFRYKALIESFEKAISNSYEATDDVSLAEAIGLKVTIVEGSYKNIKITTPEDIILAKELLD